MGGKRRRNTGEAAKKRFKSEKEAESGKKQEPEEEKHVTGNSNDTENKPTAELIQEAKYYLESWQAAQANPESTEEPKWRFKKAKQVWVLRWMYRADVVNKALFTIVLEYLGGMQGVSRERVLREAQEIVETIGNQDKVDEKDQTLQQKLERRKLKRAFQIAKVLA
ncbi:Aste57867_14761 [Aphanomyces stellatus]|uniref:Aste57867_14761 protein n=1 Tax=Aphanomyces stellatus TaxID=120398 RepID=A0A485L230_9STRA|nr:hypothetical protein As57867_014706 [Aphanomyces stellatus]VFT91579.1 Aste57867_14761 [Aphanomyces stellatus]